MKKKISHKENLAALRRIEGQVKGVQRMVEKEKYCIDIITQIHAATHALYRVSEKILAKHIGHCVVDAFKGKSNKDKESKIKEIMLLVKKLHNIK
jgi:DNA-binding FrmR family transcriptional regulator